MAEHLYTFINPSNPKHLAKIDHVLQNHGVVALPMGTSWAFCCNYKSKKGIEKLRKLNPNHPDDRPFSLICHDISMISEVGSVGNQNYRTLNKIFPGAFTVILNSHKQLSKRLGDKRQTVGVRIPNEQITLDVIVHHGEPLVATSVPSMTNGEPCPCTMGYQVFENHEHMVDIVVDLGEDLPGTDTTVLDLTGDEIVVIREGAGDLDLL